MKNLFAVIACFFCIACTQKSEFARRLSGSDSLVIQFNKLHTNSIEKSVNTTSKTAIHKMASFLNTQKVQTRSCYFNGNIIFYNKKNRVADIVFNNAKKECWQFTFELNGALTSRAMRQEAADFLKSLAEGKSSY